MTTAITELQTLLASHPFVWLGAGITAIALALSIALWRTQLSFGAKVEGSLGCGGQSPPCRASLAEGVPKKQ